MVAGLALHRRTGNSELAASTAGHLCSLSLAMGNIRDAVRYARLGIGYADRSGVAVQRVHRRATLGYALHQAGDFRGAERAFQNAVRLAGGFVSGSPPLLFVYGLRFCELLLQIGKISEAGTYAAEVMRHAKSSGYLLDIGYGHLIQALVGMARAQRDGDHLGGLTRRRFDSAVRAFRLAARDEHLVLGLLSRARMWQLLGDTVRAQQDLCEAWEIAERGPMRLHMADIHLHRARLFRDKEELQKARAMIEQCGYWRRKEELEDAEEAAKGW